MLGAGELAGGSTPAAHAHQHPDSRRVKSRLKVLLELPALLRRYWPIARPGPRLVIASTLAMLASALLDGVGIYLLVPLIDLLQAKVPEGGDHKIFLHLQQLLPGYERGQLLGPYCAIIVAAVLLRALAAAVVIILNTRLTIRVTVNVREALFRRLLHAQPGVFDRTKTGEMTGLFTGHAGWVTLGMENLLQIIMRGSLVTMYLALVIFMSWQVAVLLLGIVAIVGGLVAMIQAPLKRRSQQVGVTQIQLSGLLSDTFGGMRVVRYSGAQAGSEAGFRAVNVASGDAERAARRLSGAMPTTLDLIAMLAVMVIVVVTYYWLIRHRLLEASALMGILFAVSRVLPNVNHVATSYGLLTVAATLMEQLEEWLRLPSFPKRPFGREEFAGIRKELRFEGLSFDYSPDKPALADVTFAVPAGAKVALVGASGSGKSTIAAILMRLREPGSGRILVDGTDFWDFSPESWHRRLGVVEQEPFLFHATIRANIGFGLPDVTPEQISAALRIADLEKVVAAQPQGIDTEIGERGATLSGGQRQRLAIARAVARDPHLLILDEATSALDTITEREVQRALDEAMRNRTTLIIAHRLSTVRNADLIVVLDHGRVVEQGTWTELTERDGPFARLVRLNELKG
jgi:ATP-binding cassette, subfamily B, bacterial MsbA